MPYVGFRFDGEITSLIDFNESQHVLDMAVRIGGGTY
jgi:hypothetical protein